MDDAMVSEICKALADVNRLHIINMLTSGEKCGCELLDYLNITQPTLSHHMKVLERCGLVKGRKEGKWMYYRINCEQFLAFKAYFSQMTCCENAVTDPDEGPCRCL